MTPQDRRGGDSDKSRGRTSREGRRAAPRSNRDSGAASSRGSSDGPRTGTGARGGSGRSEGAGKARSGEAGKPRRDFGKPGSDRDARGGSRSGGGGERSRGSDSGKDRSRSTAGRWRRDELPEAQRTAVQTEYDGPPIPEEITGNEIDRSVANQLRSLPEKLAGRVARHLVAAGRLMDTDPETAYKHTLAARARASRVAIVREASGEAAYAAGRFKEALTEFKAARRMSGNSMYLPMMADCERALGRPERALQLAKDPAVFDLDETGQIEMRIVESGARRDTGDFAAAIRALEGRELRSHSRAAWVPRLRYAYAEALLADGQSDAALEWFQRAAGVDADGYTDAAERVAELEGTVVIDTAEPDSD